MVLRLKKITQVNNLMIHLKVLERKNKNKINGGIHL